MPNKRNTLQIKGRDRKSAWKGKRENLGGGRSFKKKRRQSECSRDWSSGVCSSDPAGFLRRSGVRDSGIRCLTRSTRSKSSGATATRSPKNSPRSEEHTSELQSL